jgi:hypothetical protein
MIQQMLDSGTIKPADVPSLFARPAAEVFTVLEKMQFSEAALGLIGEWKRRAGRTESEALVFATWTGSSLSPNNVFRRLIFPACNAAGLPKATWLSSVSSMLLPMAYSNRIFTA